jgi:anti-sigma regulatory factor (Ser/Thr protein kinase)
MSAITNLHAEAIAAAGRSLPVGPQAVAAAREFAAQFVANRASLGGDHLHDVVLLVSELVTNAIKYGGAGRANIYLEIGMWSKWTLITVDDRIREVYEAAPVDDDEDLRESGRGLEIVEVLAERFWWHPRSISKTANAVILRSDAELTDEDNAILDGLEKAE